ncbi:MAG: hypothetical protein QOH21_3541 [Acidobacteriota bacterium]|nr:hypothetical protein [Acidobacteriota bacterium]
MIRRSVALAALLLCFAAVTSAQTSAQAAIPTPDEFLGYKLGERFTPHHRILAYFDELTRRSDLITMRQIGETYENRPLMLATLTAPKNRTALDSIRRNVASLARGEVDATRAAEIARSTPAVVWLGFGVHGNESSSAEAGMLVASELLRNPQVLDNLIVIIDPLLNPDGRERYTDWYRRTRGTKANASPQAFEHQEPWPGGRYNHYMIDMNRDWTWMSQRETQARIAAYREWNPQVFVDFHEMSAESSYFFPPDAKPINQNLPSDVEHWLEVFGRANAAEFSKRGWPFFVAETFDLFYPGYGDAWPSLHGAVGMTYEVAGGGRGGTTYRREDGTSITLNDRLMRHFTTGMATVRTAAANREALLMYTYDAARSQMEGGKNVFLLLPNSPNFPYLVDLLQRQDVRVDMLTAPVTMRATRLDRDDAESRSFPVGTAVVSTRQPYGRLANTLLEKSGTLDQTFLDEQKAKAAADEPDEFYDLTTWSLPLAMNVEAYVTQTAVTGTTELRKPAPVAFRTASYGYVIDGLDPNVYRLAGQLLENKVNFSVIDSDAPAGDRTFSRGSLVVLKGNNPATLDATLERVVTATGATVIPLESGWVGGLSFGSDRVHHVRDPKIGLVGGPGVAATSYGMLWHTLDVDTPIPHETLGLDSLANLDLSEYRVLVFPDGNYATRLGKRGVDKIKAWVSDGGTIVAIGGANAFLREKDVEISKLKPWEAPKKKDDDKTPVTDQRYNDYRIPGSAFRTTMNTRSYLTFGVPRPPAVLVEGSNAYQPVGHAVDNILTIDPKNPLISGVAWPESLERMKGAVYVVNEPFGRGQVVTFADEPHYRLFWRATLPVFLNAVLYGPSFER